jgi:hypothetical protein
MGTRMYLYWPFHGGSEIKIFEVTSHEMRIRGKDDAVEQQLGSAQISSLGADVTGILDEEKLPPQYQWPTILVSVGYSRKIQL